MLFISSALGTELGMTWLRSSFRKKMVLTTGRVGEMLLTSTSMIKIRAMKKRKEVTRDQ